VKSTWNFHKRQLLSFSPTASFYWHLFSQYNCEWIHFYHSFLFFLFSFSSHLFYSYVRHTYSHELMIDKVMFLLEVYMYIYIRLKHLISIEIYIAERWWKANNIMQTSHIQAHIHSPFSFHHTSYFKGFFFFFLIFFFFKTLLDVFRTSNRIFQAGIYFLIDVYLINGRRIT